MDNASFSWGDKEALLSDINIRVATGELVAVVGSVGSGKILSDSITSMFVNQFVNNLISIPLGKSSLLSAFLGEMDRLSGRVNTVGSIAYVSQNSFSVYKL